MENIICRHFSYVVNEDSYPELSVYFRRIKLQLLISFECSFPEEIGFDQSSVDTITTKNQNADTHDVWNISAQRWFRAVKTGPESGLTPFGILISLFQLVILGVLWILRPDPTADFVTPLMTTAVSVWLICCSLPTRSWEKRLSTCSNLRKI